MKEIVIAGTAILLFGAAIYFAQKYLRGKIYDLSSVEEETVEGELHFDDVLDFYKGKQLKKDVHVPFILKSDATDAFGVTFKGAEKLNKTDYVTVLLGVFNSTSDKFEDALIIHAKSHDEKLTSLLDQDKLVVLG